MSDLPDGFTVVNIKGDVAEEQDRTLPKGFQSIDLKNPPQGLLDKVGGVAKQAARGIAKVWTYPADIAKLVSMASSLELINEMQEEAAAKGETISPDDIEKVRNTIFEAHKKFPTQDLAEQFITERTGIDFKPHGKLEEAIGYGSEIASLRPSGTLARRAATGLAAAGTREAMKLAGAPESAADIVGAIAGGGLGAIGETVRPASGAGAEAAQIAEKHRLRKFAGVEAETPPGRFFKTSEAKLMKSREELAKTSREAIDRIIEDRVPAAKLVKEGHDLETIYTRAYKEAENTARDVVPQKSNPLVAYIDKEIASIKKKAPSLSKADEHVIDILNAEKRNFLTKTEIPESKILDAQGSPITKARATFAPKELSGKELIGQFQAYNENLGGLYRKPEIAGMEERVRETYEGLKDVVRKMIGRTGNDEFKKSFNYANDIYSQSRKLQRVEHVLDEVFDHGYNPKRLDTILKSKTEGKHLRRELGKSAVQELREIAKYGKRAEEFVLSRMKTPDKMDSLLSNLKGVGGLLFFTNPTLYGGVEATRNVINKVRSMAMLSDGPRRALLNLTKAMSTGKDSVIIKTVENFNRAIIDEYGSEENFMKMAY